MLGQRRSHTLRTKNRINEAYLKLADLKELLGRGQGE
jgi:hypothetical protein